MKKAPVQPVLPALPLLSKSAKTRTAKAKSNAPALPPLGAEPGPGTTERSVDRAEDSKDTKAFERVSGHEEQSVGNVPHPALSPASIDTTPQPSQEIPESDGSATQNGNDRELVNEAVGTNSLSSKLEETPSQGPIDQFVHTESPDQIGPTRSDTSVSSADYAAYEPADNHGAGINESQVWSEDANVSSQPTSTTHETPDTEDVGKESHPRAGDEESPSKGSRTIEAAPGYAGEATQSTQWPPTLANGTANSHPRPQSRDQLSVPLSGRRSSAGSTTTPYLPSLSEHLLHLANSRLWADWVLLVHSGGLQPLAIYAHGILLMRSVRLNQAMSRQAASQHGANVIDIYPPRMVFPHAFETALRFFYSDTILSRDALLPRTTPPDSRTVRGNALDFLLSYWISGIELGVEPIVTRSAHLLVELLDWDIAEATMKEAIELDSACWRTGHQPADVTLEYAAMALQLKQTVLNYLASHINPATFKLDTKPALSLIRPRFAAIEDHRARHNPALSSMVFGSMPSSADLPSSSPQPDIVRPVEETIVSNILLNVDFNGIVFFYRQLQASHGAAATSFMAKVVEERESGRSKLVSNRAIPNKQRTANANDWDVAGYREFVDGAGLRRERVGFLLPTKSL